MVSFKKFNLYNSAFESFFSQIIRIWKLFFDQLEPTFIANFHAYNRKRLFHLVETSFFYPSVHPW